VERRAFMGMLAGCLLAAPFTDDQFQVFRLRV